MLYAKPKTGRFTYLERCPYFSDICLFVNEENRDYGFKDQIQRASVSIMNNIAEGFEYNSDSSFIRYLNIAKGSCAEVRSMLYLCEDLGYCTSNERLKLQNQVISISSGIYKLIEYLRRKTID